MICFLRLQVNLSHRWANPSGLATGLASLLLLVWRLELGLDGYFRGSSEQKNVSLKHWAIVFDSMLLKLNDLRTLDSLGCVPCVNDDLRGIN